MVFCSLLVGVCWDELKYGRILAVGGRGSELWPLKVQTKTKSLQYFWSCNLSYMLGSIIPLSERQTDRHTETHRHTERQTDTQRDRQTERQTGTQRDRQGCGAALRLQPYWLYDSCDFWFGTEEIMVQCLSWHHCDWKWNLGPPPWGGGGGPNKNTPEKGWKII